MTKSVTVGSIFLLVLASLTLSTRADLILPPDVTENQIEDSTGGDVNPSEIPDPQVQTTGGPVIGSQAKDGHSDVFFSIPYGTAPRFGPSVPASPWTEPLRAQKPAPPCYQHLKSSFMKFDVLGTMSMRPWTEDCLTLTVWSPRPRVTGAPVVVYIHHGSFILGSSLRFVDGSHLAEHGIVVVSPNYRLGVFGFFTLGIPEAPGNQGLMDQALALRWVRDNAAFFGGDNSRVTLLGVSAGSASVGHQLLSPVSRGLFSAAVLMGASPSNPWAVKDPERAVKKSRELMETMGCKGPKALDCLRAKDPEDVLEFSEITSFLSNENFVPTVDGHFLVEHPSVTLAAGRLASPVPVLAGTTKYEGAGFMSYMMTTSDGRTTRNQFLNILRRLDPKLNELQIQALNVLYTDPESPDDPLRLRDAAVRIYGDALIVCGVNELLESLAGMGAPVYRYEYVHTGGLSFFERRNWATPTHGAESIPVISPRAALGDNATELAITDRFRQHFINFVKNRDPNLSKEDYPDEPSWPLFDLTHKRHLQFDQKSSVHCNLRSQECRAWSRLLPALAEQC